MPQRSPRRPGVSPGRGRSTAPTDLRRTLSDLAGIALQAHQALTGERAEQRDRVVEEQLAAAQERGLVPL